MKENKNLEFVEIQVHGTKDKPYYEIHYIENGEHHIGYSSYNIKYVSDWLKEFFIEPVVHGQWISVKDKLPENEEYVLVICGLSNKICLAFYEDGTVQEDFSKIAFDEDADDWIEYDEKYDKSYIKRGWYEGNWYSEYFVEIPTEDVKYWMPLPLKPDCSAKMDESEVNDNGRT